MFEKKHREKMGSAIWLFGWLCTRQTKDNGLVHGGTLFTYPEIASDMDESPRRIERWMWKLRDEGYISVKHGLYKKLVIRVLNQRKFPKKQKTFAEANPDFHIHQQTADIKSTSKRRNYIRPHLADMNTRNGGFNGEKRREERKSEEIPSRNVVSMQERSPELVAATARMENEIPAFERFRSEYPKKGGTVAQVKFWFLRSSGVERIEEIMAGVEMWRLSGQWDQEQFIPDPVNFLRRKKWMDIPKVREGRSDVRESIEERRSRESLESIASVLGVGVSGMARAISRPLSPATFSDQRRLLSRDVIDVEPSGTGRLLQESNGAIGVHADGCDDPKCVSRTSIVRGDPANGGDLSIGERGGTRVLSGRRTADQRHQVEDRDRGGEDGTDEPAKTKVHTASHG